MSSQDSQIAISLGWNCSSATWAIENNVRKTKSGGYMTCPFDLMNTTYDGVVQCFKDDFQYLTDTKYIELKKVKKTCKFLDFKEGDELIMNTKYNFNFNHESPSHGNLHIHENWPNGTHHFVLDNFKEFTTRYNNRVQNLKNYLNSNSKIIFVIKKINNNSETCKELYDVIKEKYPNLDFSFIYLEENSQIDLFNEYLNCDFL